MSNFCKKLRLQGDQKILRNGKILLDNNQNNISDSLNHKRRSTRLYIKNKNWLIHFFCTYTKCSSCNCSYNSS